MANLKSLNFNPHEVPPEEEYQPIPAGWYPAIIASEEMKPTKAGTGHYLKLKLQILSGQYQNRTVFDLLNIDNPNPVAVKIAQQRLSKICHVLGMLNATDTQQLHNKPLQIKLSVKTGDYQGNEVTAYKSRHVEAPTAPAPVSARPNLVVQAFEDTPVLPAPTVQPIQSPF